MRERAMLMTLSPLTPTPPIWTHVKSCKMTRAGLKGISTDFPWLAFQLRMLSTSDCLTWYPSQFLTADSSSTRIENGNSSARGELTLAGSGSDHPLEHTCPATLPFSMNLIRLTVFVPTKRCKIVILVLVLAYRNLPNERGIRSFCVGKKTQNQSA